MSLLPKKKEVYNPTDEQVGNGAYYDLREIIGWNAYADAVRLSLIKGLEWIILETCKCRIRGEILMKAITKALGE